MVEEVTQKVRKLGSDFELSDEEIVTVPVNMLSPDQRKRRRALNRQKANDKAREKALKRKANGKAKIVRCMGTKKNGEPCGSFAVTGSRFCISHTPDADLEILGIKPLTKAARERRALVKKQSAPAFARKVFEGALDKVMAPYLEALGLRLIGVDEDDKPIFEDVPNGGLMLHGTSKDGDVVMSDYPDLAGRVVVAEKLWDRVYGKPKQTQILEGGDKPVRVEPVRTEDRAMRVAAILQSVGALPQQNGAVDTVDGEAVEVTDGDGAEVIELPSGDE